MGAATLSEWRQTQRRAQLWCPDQVDLYQKLVTVICELVDSAKTMESKWLLNSRTWCPHCRMVRAATHEKVSAAILLLSASMQHPIERVTMT